MPQTPPPLQQHKERAQLSYLPARIIMEQHPPLSPSLLLQKSIGVQKGGNCTGIPHTSIGCKWPFLVPISAKKYSPSPWRPNHCTLMARREREPAETLAVLSLSPPNLHVYYGGYLITVFPMLLRCSLRLSRAGREAKRGHMGTLILLCPWDSSFWSRGFELKGEEMGRDFYACPPKIALIKRHSVP